MINPLTYGIDAFKHVLLRNGTPPLGPEFSLALDLFVVTAISSCHAYLRGAVVQEEGVSRFRPRNATKFP